MCETSLYKQTLQSAHFNKKMCTFLYKYACLIFVYIFSYLFRCSYEFELLFSDEMLEAEGGGLAARVGALERRSLEQGEQLLCLRSSLADALRRLALLETARNGTHTPNTPTRCKFNH